MLALVSTLTVAAVVHPIRAASQDVASTIPEWAKTAEAKWAAAVEGRHSDALISLYATDPVMILPMGSIRGREPLERFLRAYLQRVRATCVWKIDGMKQMDQLASVWG